MLLYTANIGGYDKLQVTEQPGFDFYCWKAFINIGLTNVKLARYYKIMLPEDYDTSIWMDSNIKINCDLKEFVDKWLTKDVDMVAMEHGRDCIYEEMQACLDRKKDNKLNIKSLTEFYHIEGYPKHAGMIGSGILIRRKNMAVMKLMKVWWEMVKKYSHRDQLSFNYALWKLKKSPDFDIKINYIPYSVFKNEFELIPHDNK